MSGSGQKIKREAMSRWWEVAKKGKRKKYRGHETAMKKEGVMCEGVRGSGDERAENRGESEPEEE